MIKVNFSGHPVADFAVAPLVGANLPQGGDELAAYLREIVLALPERAALLQGAPLEVILPGLSHAGGVLNAELHGQFGSFPRIRWAVRGESGFTWPEWAVCDLAAVRESARTAR